MLTAFNTTFITRVHQIVGARVSATNLDEGAQAAPPNPLLPGPIGIYN